MTTANSREVGDLIVGFKKKRYYSMCFIKWVLSRYQLGTVGEYVRNKWTLSGTYNWGHSSAIPNSLLELIQKDIIIARLCGKIAGEDCKTFDELFEEYQKLDLDKKLK